MEASQAVRILRALADGIDPYTGEVFPQESPYQHPDTVRALLSAVGALERSENSPQVKQVPEGAGRPWEPAEEDELKRSFDSGVAIKELALRHRRTEGAIRSRLVRLGKIIP